MANHKSAKKRARQSVKRSERNRDLRSRVRTAIKGARAAIESGDAEAAGSAVRRAEGVLRRAASKGVLPKARVDRQVSRLAKAAPSRPA